MRSYRHYAVYILSNKWNTVLYTGVTGNLPVRIRQHKEGHNDSFTKRYKVTKVVYYELYDRPLKAIMREKQIKAGSRKKKEQLIMSMNPGWDDLSPGLTLGT